MTEPAVLPAIAALREEMVTLRRHIHAHPELGFEERRTAALVAECLEAWGYQVSRGVGRTGVVGTLCRGEGPPRGPRAPQVAPPNQQTTRRPHPHHVGGGVDGWGHLGPPPL
ncbi:amidohydrolase, partial [Pseudomonas aeruginosa]